MSAYCLETTGWFNVIMRLSLNCACYLNLAKPQGLLQYVPMLFLNLWLCLLQNCSISRSTADALVTVPSHYDTLPSNIWQSSTEAQI